MKNNDRNNVDTKHCCDYIIMTYVLQPLPTGIHITCPHLRQLDTTLKGNYCYFVRFY